MLVHTAAELLLSLTVPEQWACRICIVANYSFTKIASSSLNVENVT